MKQKKAKITAISSAGSSTKYCKGVYCIMNPSEKPNEEFDWTSKAQKSRKSKCRLCIREERRMKRHENRAKAFDAELRFSAIITAHENKRIN